MAPKSLFGYDVVSELGRGAASIIYAVSDPKSGQLYALKHVVRTNEREQRFVDQVMNEFQVSKACNHPVLRKVVELKTVKKFFGPVTEAALIMELIDGTPYDEAPLSDVGEILDCFILVAGGLWEIGKRGYVHCDTKPNNIMLTESGPRVIDLGQACKSGTEKERVQGTPSFIAPEQVRCKPLTELTDVYNFAATLYWALTATRVPTLLTVEKTDRKILSEQTFPAPVDLNNKVPRELSRLIMQCLRYIPSEREQGMANLQMRLEDIRAEMPKAGAAA